MKIKLENGLLLEIDSDATRADLISLKFFVLVSIASSLKRLADSVEEIRHVSDTRPSDGAFSP